MKDKGFITVEITKIDEENRTVEGYATTDSVDLCNEIIDRDATAEAIQEYEKWRNVRYMHQPHAVGVVQDMEIRDEGFWVRAKVVDEECWVKVREGVLKAFSIGYRVLDCIWDAAKKAWRITKYILIEISLVDRPANPDCVFSMVKRAPDDLPGDFPDAAVNVKFPTAPENESWDGVASDYELEEYARACAIVKGVADPHRGKLPDGLTKAQCKLPHHKPDGTLVKRGIVAAWAAANGARGGVKGVTEEDLERGGKHLKKHAKDSFNLELKESKAWIARKLFELSVGDFFREIGIGGKTPTTYDEVLTDYDAEVALREFRDRLWKYVSALETTIENIFESDEDEKPGLIAAAVSSFHEDVKELLAESPGKAAGTSTEVDEEMNEDQVRELVGEEVGKAKAEIVAELGGKLDDLKAALPATETKEDPADPEPKPTTEPAPAEPEPAESEPETEPTPDAVPEPNLDEKIGDIEKRLNGLEAGTSRAATGQDEPPEPDSRKWSGVLENVFHDLPR